MGRTQFLSIALGQGDIRSRAGDKSPGPFDDGPYHDGNREAGKAEVALREFKEKGPFD